MATTTHDDREIAKEIAMLRSQLKDFAGNGAGSIGDDLKHTLRSVRELLSKHGETARSVVRETADAAREIAHDGAKLRDKAGGALVHQTEAHPFTTVAAILGIGFLAGWLCRR